MTTIDLQAVRARLAIYSEPIPDPHEIVDRLGRDPRANSEARGTAGLLVGLRNTYMRDVPDLLALVDQMREALVALEWRWSDNANGYCCPTCLSWRDERGPGPDYPPPKRHGSGCTLDAALVGAGLPDQPSRDAARAGMRGGR